MLNHLRNCLNFEFVEIMYKYRKLSKINSIVYVIKIKITGKNAVYHVKYATFCE